MFLPNFIKIDPYNFELYRFKLGAFFLRHSVVAHPPNNLRRGQRRPLWAQTLQTSSEWSSPQMFQIL